MSLFFFNSILDIHELLEDQEVQKSPIVKRRCMCTLWAVLNLISELEFLIMLGNNLVRVLFHALFGHFLNGFFIFLMSVNCLLMTQDSNLAIRHLVMHNHIMDDLGGFLSGVAFSDALRRGP